MTTSLRSDMSHHNANDRQVQVKVVNHDGGLSLLVCTLDVGKERWIHAPSPKLLDRFFCWGAFILSQNIHTFFCLLLISKLLLKSLGGFSGFGFYEQADFVRLLDCNADESQFLKQELGVTKKQLASLVRWSVFTNVNVTLSLVILYVSHFERKADRSTV